MTTVDVSTDARFTVAWIRVMNFLMPIIGRDRATRWAVAVGIRLMRFKVKVDHNG